MCLLIFIISWKCFGVVYTWIFCGRDQTSSFCVQHVNEGHMLYKNMWTSCNIRKSKNPCGIFGGFSYSHCSLVEGNQGSCRKNNFPKFISLFTPTLSASGTLPLPWDTMGKLLILTHVLHSLVAHKMTSQKCCVALISIAKNPCVHYFCLWVTSKKCPLHIRKIAPFTT